MADLPVVYERKDLIDQVSESVIFPYFEEAIRSNIRVSEAKNNSKDIYTDVFFYVSQRDPSAIMFFRVLTAEGAEAEFKTNNLLKEKKLPSGIYIESYRPNDISCKTLLNIISEYVINIHDDRYLLYFGDDIHTCCKVMSLYASSIYEEEPSGLIGYETWDGVSIFNPVNKGGFRQLSKVGSKLENLISNITRFIGK